MGLRHGYVTATDGGRLEFRRIGVARSLFGLLILLLSWVFYTVMSNVGLESKGGN